MGKRGPKRLPTQVLKLRGSRWADRPDEPAPPEGKILPPRWLTDAGREVWEQMFPIVEHMGTITPADAGRFGRYCNAQGRYEQDPDAYDINQFASLTQTLAKYEAQFGLGAADRAGLKVEKREEKPTKKRFFK